LDTVIRIGTRGSKLALWQAYHTQDALRAHGIDSELKIIKTQGDRIQHLSFDKMEGKGFFTKEIEDALLRGDVDVAVHSMKDLPTHAPPGLVITAVSTRGLVHDNLVVRKDSVDEGQLFKLKKDAVVGTSSARRKAQMLDFRPDITIKDIRGNVPTRLRKLQEEHFDAILLAAAGLDRLKIDMSDYYVYAFNPKEFVPAPAQGVLAWQVNEEDTTTRRLLKHIHQKNVSTRTNVERGVLNMLNGGCQMPLGVYCERDQNGNYHVWAALADAWNAPVRRTHISSATSYQLAEQVLEGLGVSKVSS